ASVILTCFYLRLVVECRVVASLISKVEGFSSDTTDAEATDYAVRSQDVPLDETNIGNKLLKSMGWTEGRGIGKNNQGMNFSGVLKGFSIVHSSDVPTLDRLYSVFAVRVDYGFLESVAKMC
uniref:G-patch domain-containing protein n=1 Tax=Parascaris equorum TaxID=6256 RepID=A0A914R9T0_PAREQ